MKPTDASEEVIKAVGVVLEVTGTDLSPGALRAVMADLAAYPEEQVLGALRRCMRELKPKQFSLAAVLERMDDGRPGPEEAWSLVPKDEASSVVWTSEMAEAHGVAWALMLGGEFVQARMAFLERYRKLVQEARDARREVKWQFSPGLNKDGRELVVIDAVAKGRLTMAAAQGLLPYHHESEELTARLLSSSEVRRLAAPKVEDTRSEETKEKWRRLGATLGAKVRA